MKMPIKAMFTLVLLLTILDAVWSQDIDPSCDENSVRLVDGISSLEGRVEVCINGEWGTVCDRSWDLPDAIVVCRELGHSTLGARALVFNEFGEGTGNIVLSNVRCHGSESALVSCPAATKNLGCSHSMDSGVRCQPLGTTPKCVENSMRLVGGDSSLEGLVEICANGDWATVCHDSWDNNDAIVVCRQLQHSTLGAQAFAFAFFGKGNGSIHLNNVRCNGMESTLLSCPASRTFQCHHGEDAGVRCQPLGSSQLCIVNSVRLAGSNSSLEGRVEVCSNGVWGTVCDQSWERYWDFRDAIVVCRELGHSTIGAQAFRSAAFGRGTGNILLSRVWCNGTEAKLVSCPSSVPSIRCSHFNDVGVSCQPIGSNPVCTENTVRLARGISPLEGHVEMCVNGGWGTVSDEYWDYKDATVVCRELGHSTVGAQAFDSVVAEPRNGVTVISRFRCEGQETVLVSCPSSLYTLYSNNRVAGVQCQANGTVCEENSVRLVSGSNSSLEGQVEVCINGGWGTVCDGTYNQLNFFWYLYSILFHYNENLYRVWDFHDAAVVCRQLGHSTVGARAIREFGNSMLNVLSYVLCNGTESTLVSCPTIQSYSTCPSSYSDAGVSCQPFDTSPECDENSVRLVGGNSSLGLVEVCINGVWGRVCDRFWDKSAAIVVCGQLGHSVYGAQNYSSAEVNVETENKYLAMCNGTETTLTSCLFSTCLYTHKDSGVHCQPSGAPPDCVENTVRLVKGSSFLEGQVEVCVDGNWGTVCDRLWNLHDAIVVCNQLGHSTVGAQAFSSNVYGQNGGRIVLYDVRCNGTEKALVSCPSRSHSNIRCPINRRGVGVRCRPKASKLNPRYGNMLGGTAVLIDPGKVEFKETEKIFCTFEGIQVPGRKVNNTLVMCVSPLLNKPGYVPFTLRIGTRHQESHFLSISPERAHAASFSGQDLLLTFNTMFSVKWPPNQVAPELLLSPDTTVDISLYIQRYSFSRSGRRFTWEEINKLKKDTPNDGEETVTIPSNIKVSCEYPIASIKSFPVCPVAIKISISKSSYLPKSTGIWTGIAFLRSSYVKGSNMRKGCIAWSDNEKSTATRLSTLSPCPPNQVVAFFDIAFEREDRSSVYQPNGYEETYMEFFHPNIKDCYRRKEPGSFSGQQCCYGNNGVLVKGPSAGGSADSYSPKTNFNQHVIQDLVPYILCCKPGVGYGSCKSYYIARPSGSEERYQLPVPACVYGDPHIVTLDGHKYTFNGKGEFTLIETEDNVFTLQGRMEQILDPEGSLTPGTVFTAIVAKESSTDTSVQFEIEGSGLRTLVNSEVVVFDDVSVQEFDDIALLDKGNNTILAILSGGANIEIKAENGIISVMLISLPESFLSTTQGLMGTFNGIKPDDLVPKGESQSIPLDSSLEDIHNEFGITWIIDNEADSLFTYKEGESWSTFYSPAFSPMFDSTFDDPVLEEKAKEICGDDEFCLFDVAATKKVEIGMATMEGGQAFDEIVEMSIPIICDPPCESGVCLENNTCSCNEGFEGDRCNQPIMEECEMDICENNGTCVKQVLTYSCECTPEFEGSLCESKVPPLTISLINSSPRISGDKVFVEFVTSRPANTTCSLSAASSRLRNETDCSAGLVMYDNLPQGNYNLRIISKSSNGERDVVRRKVRIGVCAVHFINEGVIVDGNRVSIQFFGLGVTSYQCRLDEGELEFCASPLRYENLSVGMHKLAVKPIGCNGEIHVMKFEIVN